VGQAARLVVLVLLLLPAARQLLLLQLLGPPAISIPSTLSLLNKNKSHVTGRNGEYLAPAYFQSFQIHLPFSFCYMDLDPEDLAGAV